MILLIVDPFDPPTRSIIEWLFSMGKQMIISNNQNENEHIDIASLSSFKPQIIINGETYPLTSISSIYYRRSLKKTLNSHLFNNSIDMEKTSKKYSLMSYIAGNSNTRLELLEYFLSGIKTFGSEAIGRINKITALIEAKKVGLAVPETLLTKNKCELVSFMEEHDQVINKSIDVSYNYTDNTNDKWYIGYTNLVTKEFIEQVPDNFPLSLFQKKINKSFEIRSFFFNDSFYSTAIFSQQNEKTSVDYRKYDQEFPNREVPFILPEIITKKLKALLKALDLNTGSVDLIMTGKDYVFLEVNPVGQYENVSFLGNWYIEKQIAEYL
ncbi:MAG: grasp-with-spasm system ATP-grasp peptide maturase [Bacteroidota bacterium]|nr:grasp-with-spasm system ATP-grasp peptide maturase [Bacteroidota bacterium]